MICNPENRFSSVSRSANATAKPPTPSAVSSGVIEISNDCKISNAPIDQIAIRAKLVSSEAEACAAVLRCRYSPSKTAATRPASNVNTKMTAAPSALSKSNCRAYRKLEVRNASCKPSAVSAKSGDQCSERRIEAAKVCPRRRKAASTRRSSRNSTRSPAARP